MNGSKQKVQKEEETWEVISAYTREQAIADGVLVDVSETAKEAGFKFPVALTYAVWFGYVRVPRGVAGQDEAGRLWDILWMTRHAIQNSATESSRVLVQLYVRNDNDTPTLVTLKALIGPGDHGDPVITVMMRYED
jgi:hypothetical protein